MGRIGIRTFFVICIAATIGVMGIWYALLPPQSDFLRDKRWTSDQQNLKRIIEDNAISILYLYNEPTRKSYVRGAITTTSEPLEYKDFENSLERFRIALPRYIDPGFIEYIDENFDQRNDRYSAALTTASFTLVKEEFEAPPSPYVPPLVSSRDEENITVYALSFFKPGTRWDVWIMAQESDRGWVVTRGMVERFVPDEFIMT
jgi:hypothetical protein